MDAGQTGKDERLEVIYTSQGICECKFPFVVIAQHNICAKPQTFLLLLAHVGDNGGQC